MSKFGQSTAKPEPKYKEALGLESWPEQVLSPEDYPYSEGFFNGMYDRLCPGPELEQGKLDFIFFGS